MLIAAMASITNTGKWSPPSYGKQNPPSSTKLPLGWPSTSRQVIMPPEKWVDVTSLGAAVAIDFTGADHGETIATVIHESDGSYDGPVFSL